MSGFAGLYDIRDMQPDDRNLILATFLRGVYYGDSWFSLIPKRIFMDNYKKMAELFVTNPRYTIKVACLKEDPNVIIGYSIMSADFQTLHWIYVKSSWRQKGIARSLAPKHPAYVSHLSSLGKTLLPKLKDCVFNPFSL